MQKMSVQEIEKKLIEEVAVILRADPATIKTDVLLPSLGLDSMGLVEILVLIEKHFGLRLIDTGMTREDFQSIHTIASRISQCLGS